MKILLPDGWTPPKGYSQGIVAEGRQKFVAGQIGWDETVTFQSDDFAELTGQALRNILIILNATDAGAEHITRMTWFIPDKNNI